MAMRTILLLDVPSEETPRIQEIHLILLHLLAEEIECVRILFSFLLFLLEEKLYGVV